MARAAGVDVPEAKLLRLNSDYHTFCVRRFDRTETTRHFYASAMTLLGKEQSEGASYLELAQFIRSAGSPQHADNDARQLFRRVAFNVAVGNRDDHLRNHGFVLEKQGWRLAPAFDVNPNIDKAEHVLCIDDLDNRPSIETVLSTREFYGLNAVEAEAVVEQVLRAVDDWKEVARREHLSSADVQVTAAAFSAHTESRTGANEVARESE